ncbi:MAG: Alcohol dehydrogenase, partial [uncultured Rubrobacteraceae bacterium]
DGRGPREPLQARGHPHNLRAGIFRGGRLGTEATRGESGPDPDGPRRGPVRDTGQNPRHHRGRGHRVRGLRPGKGRALARLDAGGGGLCRGGRLRRLRRRRRRVQPGHGEGGEPYRHAPGPRHGLHLPAGGSGPQAAVPPQAVPGGADHGRDGFGGDHHRRDGPAGPQDQGRHLAPLPAPRPRDSGPPAHLVHALRRYGRLRPRRRLPRRRVVHRQTLPHAPGTGLAGQEAAVPGGQPRLGPLGLDGARVRRGVPAAGRGRRRGRRGARAHDARCLHRGDRVRLGGDRDPARLRLPHSEPQARLPVARLPGGAVRPARVRRHRNGARRLQVHLPRRPRQAPPRRRADRRKAFPRRRRRHAAERPDLADEGRRGPGRPAGAGLRRGGRGGARGGRDQAAAPAHHRPQRGRTRRPGRDLPRVDAKLV